MLDYGIGKISIGRSVNLRKIRDSAWHRISHNLKLMGRFHSSSNSILQVIS